jgi:hypothetical protein
MYFMSLNGYIIGFWSVVVWDIDFATFYVLSYYLVDWLFNFKTGCYEWLKSGTVVNLFYFMIFTLILVYFLEFTKYLKMDVITFIVWLIFSLDLIPKYFL